MTMYALAAPILALLYSSASTSIASAGDSRHVSFELPFEQALEHSRSENRMLFLKPVYGGMDRAGAEDYREGQW